MTTPQKKYQNISFKELILLSENNPHSKSKLDLIENIVIKPLQETTLDNIGLDEYKAYNLTPSGILSLLVCINDPDYYSLSTKNFRSQQIIELATKLQLDTEQLKNSSIYRKRKKLYDLIGDVYNGKKLEEKDYIDLYSGISFLRDIQFILIKSNEQDVIEEGVDTNTNIKGEILFATDPINWKLDKPVYIVDYYSRWVAIPNKREEQLHTKLLNWISTMEDLGWIINWTEIEGTKVEIVEELSKTINWKETDKKLSKSILSSRLGRYKTIRLFTDWLHNTANIIL
jgi:hypothetical protein